MRCFVFCIVVLVSSFAWAQPNEAFEVWSTRHFEVRYKQGQTSRKEVRIVARKAEAFFRRLASFLGHKPKNKIVISLEGNRGDDPKHRWAYVDDTAGWMHLFRFPEDSFPYQTGLSHELVHAYRFKHLSEIEMPPAPAFIFLEEGIAEYLSNLIEPKKATFVNFGHSLEVSAGQWFESGEDIPLETLLSEQYHLRPKCIPQAYTLQASFVQFLELEFGRATVRRLAFAKDIRDEETLQSYIGEPFSVLVSKWKSSLLRRYQAIPNHTELGHAWRNQTPAADMYVCKAGVDF
jgi:hypothetical protein